MAFYTPTLDERLALAGDPCQGLLASTPERACWTGTASVGPLSWAGFRCRRHKGHEGPHMDIIKVKLATGAPALSPLAIWHDTLSEFRLKVWLLRQGVPHEG